MSTESLLSLHDKLREDHWRSTHGFSEDMEQAAKMMLKTYTYDDEVTEVLRQWCMKRQPCQFGRAAASRGQIYFCVLRERDLANGDRAIEKKISSAKHHWKQRATSDPQSPPHSFLLVFATDRLMLATPDENMRRFAEHLLVLSGWEPARRGKRRENPISSDFLYLKNPSDDAYYGFQFNIDFFAAAGDKRWWHDHRLPGGIGFTANSTGHMKAFRDWYRDKGSDHGDWALKQAMITIAQAHDFKKDGDSKASTSTEADLRAEGRLTWLRELDSKKRPLLANIPSPLKNPPKQLQGKDWTRYEGLIHTDHAIREEFFVDRQEAITKQKPYLEDFTYLYDHSQEDYINFTAGKPFTADEIFAEIGRTETWTHRAGEYSVESTRTPVQSAEIAQLLKDCYNWRPSEDYMDCSVPT